MRPLKKDAVIVKAFKIMGRNDQSLLKGPALRYDGKETHAVTREDFCAENQKENSQEL
jgi:hypothetical protein